MSFRGLAMLKSTKLITKGGLCYGFAMVCNLTLLAVSSSGAYSQMYQCTPM